MRAWLDRTGLENKLPIFDRAWKVLAEFGGLSIPQRGPRGGCGGGFSTHFYPAKYAPTTEAMVELSALLGGVCVFPIGSNDDGPSHVVIDDRDRVFLLHDVDWFVLGETFDEAVVWMTRGGDRPVIDDYGRW